MTDGVTGSSFPRRGRGAQRGTPQWERAVRTAQLRDSAHVAFAARATKEHSALLVDSV